MPSVLDKSLFYVLSGYERLDTFNTQTDTALVDALGKKLHRNLLVNIADYAYGDTIDKKNHDKLIESLKFVHQCMHKEQGPETMVNVHIYLCDVVKVANTFTHHKTMFKHQAQFYCNNTYYQVCRDKCSFDRYMRFRLPVQKRIDRVMSTGAVSLTLKEMELFKQSWNKPRSMAWRKRALKAIGIKGYSKLNASNSDEFFKQAVYSDNLWMGIDTIVDLEQVRYLKRRQRYFQRLGKAYEPADLELTETQRIDRINEERSKGKKWYHRRLRGLSFSSVRQEIDRDASI